MILEEGDINNPENKISNSPVHFEIKIPMNTKVEDIKVTLIDISLYIWGYKIIDNTQKNNDAENNDENNIDNNEEKNLENYDQNINKEINDYYFLYKFKIFDDVPIGRKIRSKSTRKKRSTTTIHKDLNISNKINIEMSNLNSKENNSQYDKIFDFYNDKITCSIRFINFTNYIINEIDVEGDKSDLKNNFNENFHKLYSTIFVDKEFELFLENKMIYIKYINKKNNNNTIIKEQNKEDSIQIMNTTFGAPSEGKSHKNSLEEIIHIVSEDEKQLFEKIINIDYRKKINNLNPYIIPYNFDRKNQNYFFNNLTNIEMLKENENNLNKKNIEPNPLDINLATEQDLSIKIDNNDDDNFMKKRILFFISFILFIIIIFKILKII